VLHHVLQGRSVSVMAELTLRQARELLSDWADVVRSRDDRVRTAVESGLSKSEVSRLTGIARSTIDRIVDSAPDGSVTAQDGETSP
jgi:hypothetical protein